MTDRSGVFEAPVVAFRLSSDESMTASVPTEIEVAWIRAAPRSTPSEHPHHLLESIPGGRVEKRALQGLSMDRDLRGLRLHAR
jgi:hypothetical protein